MTWLENGGPGKRRIEAPDSVKTGTQSQVSKNRTRALTEFVIE